MKSKTLIVASFCLLLGLAAATANAQESVLQAKVPFNFVVSGKTLIAGEYTMMILPHQVKIEDANGRIVAMVLATEVSDRSAARIGHIVFHCYRYRCFLSEVWLAARENGRQLFITRAEAELAKGEKGQYFAVLGEKPQPRL